MVPYVVPAVAEHFRVEASAIIGSNRQGAVMMAKWACCVIFRELRITYREVAALMNYVDHTTPLHLTRQGDGAMEYDPIFKYRVMESASLAAEIAGVSANLFRNA